MRSAALLVCLTLAPALSAPAPGAAAAVPTHVTCGQAITADTTLDGNVVNCPGDGIVIGAPNITLDLNGFIVDRAGPTDIGAGIRNFDPALGHGYDGVTVKNGTVKQFSTGVQLRGVAGDQIRSVTVRASNTGISLSNAHGNSIEANDVSANVVGIDLGAGAGANRVAANSLFGTGTAAIRSVGPTASAPGAGGNQIVGNRIGNTGGDGILLEAGTVDTLVEGNTASRTADDGIDVRASGGAADRIGANTATDNGDLGIDAAADVTDLGGDQAHGNAGAAQCVNVGCDRANVTLIGQVPISGTSFSAMSAEAKRASAYPLYLSATVRKLTVFVDGKGAATGSQAIRGVIYANAPGGGPGALEARTFQATVAAGSPGRWVSLYFPYPPRLSQGVHWLGIHSGATGGVARFAWSPAASSRYFNVDSYSDGPSNPFGAAPADDKRISIFASGAY